MNASRRGSRILSLFATALGIWFCASGSRACTIFVLVGPDRTLLFNNEDWSNTTTRVWFVPAGEGHFGGVYFGFDDGWAQGGMNTEGLAYDWVAGVREEWPMKRGMKRVRGNPSQRMLETCSTVEQAIQFFETNYEPGFATAEILVADRSGASAIVGANHGELRVRRSDTTRGFGYGGATLQTLLQQNRPAALSNGVEILRSCVQRGRYATKYSNVFDLRSGDIFLYPAGESQKEVKLNLRNQLQKGPHYFEMSEMTSASPHPRALLPNMHRFPLDAFKPIEDPESALAARLRRILLETAEGKLRRDDYADEIWKTINPAEVAAEVKAMGKLLSVTRVRAAQPEATRSRYYRVEFTKVRFVQRITLAPDGKISESKTEASEVPAGGLEP